MKLLQYTLILIFLGAGTSLYALPSKLLKVEILIKRKQYHEASILLNNYLSLTEFRSPSSQISILNKAAYVNTKLREFLKAESQLRLAQQLIRQHHLDILEVENIFFLALNYYEKHDFHKALINFEQCLSLLSENPGDQSLSPGVCYHWIGNVYAHGFFRFTIALDYYKKALPLMVQYNDADQLASLHYDMARVFQNQSELETSVLYLDLAEAHYAATDYRIEELADCKNLRAIHFLNTGSREQHFRALHEAIDLIKPLRKPGSFNLGKYYDNLGVLHQFRRECEESLRYYRKGLAENLLHAFNEERISNGYLNLAEFYTYCRDNSDSVKYFLQKCIAIRTRVVGEKHSEMAAVYLHLGTLHDNLHQFDSALYFFQKALVADVPDFSDTHISQNPTSTGDGYSLNLPYILFGKASALYHKSFASPNSLSLLRHSFETLYRADSLLQNYRREFVWEESKMAFSGSLRFLYEKSMEIAFLLHQKTGDQKYVRKAFKLMESSKHNTLLENIRDARSDPHDVSMALRKEISHIRFLESHAKYSNAATPKPGSTHSARLLEAQKELQAYYDSTLSPKHHVVQQLVTWDMIGNVENLVKTRNTRLIEFFWGDSSLYCITVAPQQYTFRKIPIEDIQKIITSYRTRLSSPPSPRQYAEDLKDYVEESRHLYTLFFGELSFSEIRDLIVIPDGPLVLIPFETLLTRKDTCSNYGCLSYLIKECAVEYAFSAMVMQQLLKTNYSKTNSVLALTSFSKDRKNLLPAVEKELTALTRYFPQVEQPIPDSLKTFFVKQANRFSIIHISVHGQADAENGLNSFIEFSTDPDDRLYAHELYGLRLQANLVMLTACETGSGEFRRGEGLLSMGRAFVMAGSKTVVTSLWKIPDFSSASIVSDFYKNFTGDMSPAKALQASKVNYIISQDEMGAHPYYWGALCFMGAPPDAASDYRLAIIAIGVVLSFSVLMFMRKKIIRQS